MYMFYLADELHWFAILGLFANLWIVPKLASRWMNSLRYGSRLQLQPPIYAYVKQPDKRAYNLDLVLTMRL
jgi:hypothetical protein